MERRNRAHAHRSSEQAATDGQARCRAWGKPARCRVAFFRRSLIEATAPHVRSLRGSKPCIDRASRVTRAHSRAQTRGDLKGGLVFLRLRVDRQPDGCQVIGPDPREGKQRSQRNRVAEVVRLRERTIPLRAQPITHRHIDGRGLDRPGVDDRITEEDVGRGGRPIEIPDVMMLSPFGLYPVTLGGACSRPV